MDIQVGDKIIYKIFGEIKTVLITDDEDIDNLEEDIKNNNIGILKIERPKCEVIEEKKELLTAEEREFLKQYIKIINGLNNGKIYEVLRTEEDVKLILDTNLIYKIEVGSKFGKMKVDKGYTLEELGLEKN